MVFRGAGPNESVNQIITDRSKDTGYINYVPVGPLSVAAADTSGNGSVGPEDKAVGKADIFLYGLALSKSDGDANSRIANTATAAAISSWGTGANPWVFKVKLPTMFLTLALQIVVLSCYIFIFRSSFVSTYN